MKKQLFFLFLIFFGFGSMQGMQDQQMLMSHDEAAKTYKRKAATLGRDKMFAQRLQYQQP